MRRLAWLLLLALACSKKSEPETPKAETFLCTRHDQRHPVREIGYGWPDAVFALKLPPAEKARLTALRNEDVMTVGNGHFVRGWAGFTVKQRAGDWGFGLWVRVSPEDYAAIEKAGSVTSTFTGTIANQELYGAPTLGVSASLEPRGEHLRPFVRFTDPKHPLTALQKDGVGETQWRQWLSDASHDGDPEPASAPAEGTFEQQGWVIYEPAAAGKTAVVFTSPPLKNDTVKVLMGVRTADENGEPTTVNAGWWVRVDDTSRPELWSGTLASETHFESTIRFGSRIWFKPRQVVQHAPAEAATK